MSTKKDNFSSSDKFFMKLAINLARSRKGLTGDNPSVGCVIVKNNNIISIGQTGINGRPHAETNAIKNAFQNLSGAKMYVTLEPCNHYGKTPPCTKNIIKSGIKEVIYSIDDIDKKVKGKTIKILSRNKIFVKRGLLEEEVKDLYDSYRINRYYKVPFVTGKIAISKNKLIYSKDIKKITGTISDKLTHYLRFKNDAILVTSQTLNIDNPKLSCRLKGYESFSPKRVILDSKLKINLNSYIFNSIKKNNTIIFYNSLNKSKLKVLRKKGANLVRSKLNSLNNFNLKQILHKLFALGVRNLLVEGGDKITKNMLKERLFNQFYLFQSKKKLSTLKDHCFFTSFNILKNRYNNDFKITSKLANDKITIYKK